MEKIVSLCKRRGFIFPGSEIYGGLQNSWDYGPLGVELKNNIKQLWWKRFVTSRNDMVGIDAALIMNTEVWKASGHLKEFTDPLIECKKCHHRFRADEIGNSKSQIPNSKNVSACPDCSGELTDEKQFNMMFKTFLGPVEDSGSVVYLRPETAQAMFVDFKTVLQTSRSRLPFGIAQMGKAFRNEITPGNFIFRTREFEQMEIEYFVRESEWEQWFEYWREAMRAWIKELGITEARVHETEIPDGERAHYSKRTIDFQFEYPFGKEELYGLAYRTDFDLKNHFKEPPYTDPDTEEKLYPHVIEPSWGVDRSVLAMLISAYDDSNADRTVLKLPKLLAPYRAAVFPLLANKPELLKKAREIYDSLRKEYAVAWDDRGNIGKRYYSQDEIGTPYCVTIDFDTLEKGDVTVRDRDTAKQERIAIDKLGVCLRENINGRL